MRTVNRVASLLLAAALLLGGALLAAQALLVSLHRQASVLDRTGWYDTLTGTRWRDPTVRVGGRPAVLGTCVILVAQLRRWTPVAASARRVRRLAPAPPQRGARLADVAGARSVYAAPASRAAARRQVASPGTRQRRSRARPEVEYAVRQELRRLAAPPTGRSRSGCHLGRPHDQRRARCSGPSSRAAGGRGTATLALTKRRQPGRDGAQPRAAGPVAAGRPVEHPRRAVAGVLLALAGQRMLRPELVVSPAPCYADAQPPRSTSGPDPAGRRRARPQRWNATSPAVPVRPGAGRP